MKPITLLAVAGLLASCTSGSDSSESSNSQFVTTEDSLNLALDTEAEEARLEALRLEEERIMAARRDSVRTEQQMKLIPFKLLGSDLEKSLSSLGFEKDYEADPGNVSLCMSRTLYGRKITITGNAYPGSKLYEIVFSDNAEKDEFVNEIKQMGFQQLEDVYFDNSPKSNDFFRVESDKIIFGGPYIPS